MADIMCPCLLDLGIEPDSFLRKIDNRNAWNGYADKPGSGQIYQEVAEKVFREREGIYSLWKVKTEQDFYGVVASLTANATSKDRNIDFIWISEAELADIGIQIQKVVEGRCLHAKDLHFDAKISNKKAKELCRILLERERVANRCKKAHTVAIRNYQTSLGCKAVDSNTQKCKCENE
jgi:hypothetical protein